MLGCARDGSTTTGVEASPPVVAVHLSFDDAPGPSLAVDEAIVSTLRAHGAPASVFYNCDRLDADDRTIALWQAAGMEIGNHTASHARLADLGVDAWMEDVERCDAVLRDRVERPPRWFRYPYLCEGADAAERDGARARLTEMGYANAHVTVATSEWLLAGAYRVARARADAQLEAEIVAAYRTHMLESVAVARAMARAEVGRETAQVVLFHVNELAADHLDAVLTDFEAQGYTFVSLETALADPVFERENHYSGPAGLSWLARIHDPAQPREPYWFGLEEGRLEERFGELLAD